MLLPFGSNCLFVAILHSICCLDLDRFFCVFIFCLLMYSSLSFYVLGFDLLSWFSSVYCLLIGLFRSLICVHAGGNLIAWTRSWCGEWSPQIIAASSMLSGALLELFFAICCRSVKGSHASSAGTSWNTTKPKLHIWDRFSSSSSLHRIAFFFLWIVFLLWSFELDLCFMIGHFTITMACYDDRNLPSSWQSQPLFASLIVIWIVKSCWNSYEDKIKGEKKDMCKEYLPLCNLQVPLWTVAEKALVHRLCFPSNRKLDRTKHETKSFEATQFGFFQKIKS